MDKTFARSTQRQTKFKERLTFGHDQIVSLEDVIKVAEDSAAE